MEKKVIRGKKKFASRAGKPVALKGIRPLGSRNADVPKGALSNLPTWADAVRLAKPVGKPHLFKLKDLDRVLEEIVQENGTIAHTGN